MIPEQRIRLLNDHPVNLQGKFVLYWMTSARRTRFNFALDRAIELARLHNCGLLVLEPLRLGYPYASDRFHRFILEGMRDNRDRFRGSPIEYYPYLERQEGQDKGLLSSLAADAFCVVADDHPCFFYPGMLAAGARQLKCPMEAVDGNGIYPIYDCDRVFTTAHSFRRHLQKTLLPHLLRFPQADILDGLPLMPAIDLPADTLSRWPKFDCDSDFDDTISGLSIDHSVQAISVGGEAAASELLNTFLKRKLSDYNERRNHPDEQATSGLAPYLHFGQIGAHEIVRKVLDWEGFSIERMGTETRGSRNGFWGLSESAEAFLDQLVTWRELGFNMCAREKAYASYESLPDWAQATLQEHSLDARAYDYSMEEFEEARTHDPLWNAAQNELVRDGRIHNYLRMLWGKKILEWTSSPKRALQVMIHLNNKYALDGRDPNSYSGIFWCLGRYDRAWGPERKIYGKIRYMTSASTMRKLKLGDYLRNYGGTIAMDQYEFSYD